MEETVHGLAAGLALRSAIGDPPAGIREIETLMARWGVRSDGYGGAVVDEARALLMRRRPVPRAVVPLGTYRCGRCNTRGHNARSCPTRKAASHG